jgi:peptidoglycan-N-acetylglucosamine deacetylase
MRRSGARSLFVIAGWLIMAGALGGAAPALAQGDKALAGGTDCPRNPQALGTSRVLTIEPGTYRHVGLMQYRETLPLADKEVVLTFDDGPLPPYSNEILDILASQCVKATYFLIGDMAREYPAVVRRIHEEGHSIGTHSESHPLPFSALPLEKLRWQIDQGIADVGAALGNTDEIAPFFRIPGLERTDAIESELEARSLIAFSADAVADDWHHRIKPAEIVRRAMSRLEARGKGILLLHDIHRVTVAALPLLLRALKDKGFHIVHVVPATPNRIEIAADEAALSAAPPSGTGEHDAALWPTAAAPLGGQLIVLPVPGTAAFDLAYRPWHYAMAADTKANVGTAAATVGEDTLPDLSDIAPAAAQTELPVPSMQDIGLPLEGLRPVGEMAERRAGLAPSDTKESAAPASAAMSPN